MPRVRASPGRAPEGRLRAPRRSRGLGSSLSHDELQDRSGHHPCTRSHSGARLPVSGCEAGALVRRLWLGPRGGRGRIREPDLARHRCRLPRGRRAGTRSPRWLGSDRRARRRCDLDDDTVDVAGQRGRQRESRVRLCARSHAEGRADTGKNACRSMPEALWPGRRGDPRDGEWCGTRASSSRASVSGSHRADHRGRSRHARRRNRPRAYGACSRSRRLHRRRAVRAPDRQSGRRRRSLSRERPGGRRNLGMGSESRHRRSSRRARGAARQRAGRAQLPALLAAQDADYFSRNPPVVHRHGPDGRTDNAASRGRDAGSRGDSLLSLVGPRAARGYGAQPAGLVRVAAAQLGRADPVFRPPRDRRTASAYG